MKSHQANSTQTGRKNKSPGGGGCSFAWLECGSESLCDKQKSQVELSFHVICVSSVVHFTALLRTQDNSCVSEHLFLL